MARERSRCPLSLRESTYEIAVLEYREKTLGNEMAPANVLVEPACGYGRGVWSLGLSRPVYNGLAVSAPASKR